MQRAFGTNCTANSCVVCTRRTGSIGAGPPGQIVHHGKKGGEATGANPTDRGRPGTKRHLVIDRQGIPLAFLLTRATSTPPSSSTSCWIPFRPSVGSEAGLNAYLPSSMPTMPTTSDAAVRPANARASRLARQDAVSTPAEAWTSLLGRRADLRLAEPLPAPHHLLRHPPCLIALACSVISAP